MANPAGRPPKLDPVKVDRMLSAMRTGIAMDTAARFAGIPRQTLFDWLARGRAARATPVYREFVEQVEEAIAQFEVLALARITKAGDEQWQADAWRLERKFPEKYGRRTRIDGQVTMQATPWLDLSKLSSEERSTLASLLRKAAPQPEQIPEGGRPALELVAASADDVIEGEAVEVA